MGVACPGWKLAAGGDSSLSGIGAVPSSGRPPPGPLVVSPMAAPAHASGSARGTAVVWQRLAAAPADLPVLDGRTDTVPDIVGRLGAPIGLAIFTEGNHFPALLGGEIIEPFRAWAQAQVQYAELALDNIVVVTLPQPMIIQMLLRGGLTLGNLTIEVSRVSGFYPDIVMGVRRR